MVAVRGEICRVQGNSEHLLHRRYEPAARIPAEDQGSVSLTSPGSEVNPQVLFHNLASNIISRVVFGPKYDHNDPFMKLSIKAVRENAKILNGAWSMVRETS